MARRIAPRVTLTEDDLLAALDAARPERAARPPGFYTVAELAAKSGLHASNLRIRMRRLIAEGAVDTATVYVPRADGSYTPVTAYKLKAA